MSELLEQIYRARDIGPRKEIYTTYGTSFSLPKAEGDFLFLFEIKIRLNGYLHARLEVIWAALIVIKRKSKVSHPKLSVELKAEQRK